MKATIIECVMGIFAFGESNQLVKAILFPKDAAKIAEKLEKTENGKVIDEIAKLVKSLQTKDYELFIFERSELAANAREELKINAETVKTSETGELLRGNLDNFAVESGFAKHEGEIRGWLHRVSMELTKLRVRKAAEKRDLMVAQSIQTVDDLDKMLNLFVGRIREWYGLHFPELDRLIDKHETFLRLVANLGQRENFTEKSLTKEGLPKAKVRATAKAAEKSMGAELQEQDLNQIQIMCKNTLELYDVRDSMENYIETAMGEIAPNIRTLTGPLLGARLIALAGGLQNLAKMPASTIQVLGAEKALFRALKSGSRPPKHGIIFQHSLFHEVKRWQRGKVARALAGKLAIAARIDAFRGSHAGDKLKGALEERIREIQEKYTKPPPPKNGPFIKYKRLKKKRRKKRDRRG